MRKQDRGEPRKNKPQAPAADATGPDRVRRWLLAGMMALLVARPLFPSESAAAHGDGLPVVMLWLVLAFGWLAEAVVRAHKENRRVVVHFGWTDAAVMLLVGLHTLAALHAAWRYSPRPALNMLWEWIGLAACFFLARQLIRAGREARAVVAVMIALAAGISGYGLYQYAVELPALRAQYQLDPQQTMLDAGVWYAPGSPGQQTFESRLNSPEPLATFALTNSLAAFLAPWLVLAAGIAATERASRKRLFGVLACMAPMVICLLLSKSRSAFIATAVGGVLLGLMLAPRPRRFGWKLPCGAAVLAAVVIGIVAAGGKGCLLLERAARSFRYRIDYWRASMDLIADHPWAGCGPGNFQDAYTRYKLPGAAEEVADPHNFLLEAWTTAGTPTMLALVVVLGAFAWKSYRLHVHSADWRSGTGIASSPAKGGLPVHILAGAVFGFLLALPLGMISAAPPGLAALVLGLPLAMGGAALLSGWIRAGYMPPLLPALGAAVLLVDLLTTGGIGYPGVACTLWLLLALGLRSASDGEVDGPSACSAKPGRSPWAFAALTLPALLLVACYWTGYAAVLPCQRHLRGAEQELLQGRLAEAERELQAAAKADPYSPEPWRRLAQLALSDWLRHPHADAYARFEQSLAESVRLAPRSAFAYSFAAGQYLRAFAKTGTDHRPVQPEAVDKAVDYYAEAVALYPASAFLRANLAIAYKVAERPADFRREADVALELDDQSPQEDRKLPENVRRELTDR